MVGVRVASEFDHARVEVEHENELMMLVECEWAIREHETEEMEGSGWAVVGSVRGLATMTQVTTAGTYNTGDIIGKHQNRATALFRADLIGEID
jgi:hypothetical protein